MVKTATNLIIKQHFYFGSPPFLAFLTVKRTYSNVFISLLDRYSRVIITKTSGNFNLGNNKKKKKTPQAVEEIMRGLIEYIKLYNIGSIMIILRCKISPHIYTMVKELLVAGIEIKGYYDKRVVAHNGMRGRKMRRT
jgi:ribosomal protein S11